MEKWKNIQFVSEKERGEMLNQFNLALSIVKKRKKENLRKLREKMSIKDQLDKIINKFDDSLIEDHKNELE
jgi:hypothetical protein